MKDLTLPTPALPKLPVSWATSEGMRHTPAGTHEFWGYVYGDQSIAAGADLYTAEQMQDYARAALSHHEDGGRAATDKESLTVGVALGGEKGEAVAWRYSRNNGKSWHLAEQDPTELMPDSGGIVIPLFAAPVGKARMLTDEEADHITGMHNTGRSQGDSECAEAIQRKFCEVNGIELQDVQRGSKNG